MRILVLSHEYPPVGGGAGASCATLSEEYVGAGHEVTVLTMAHEDLPPEEVVNGVRVLRQPCGRRRWEMASPAEGLIWARRAWRVALGLHRRQRFHITHAHFVMPAGIVARWLQRSVKLPYVITPRGSDVPGYNRERLKLAHALARPWWKHILRHASWVVSPSASLLELIQAQLPAVKGMVIPNGGQHKPVCTGTQRAADPAVQPPRRTERFSVLYRGSSGSGVPRLENRHRRQRAISGEVTGNGRRQ